MATRKRGGTESVYVCARERHIHRWHQVAGANRIHACAYTCASVKVCRLMYMYVCMCMCMYVQVRVHVNVHTHVLVHV